MVERRFPLFVNLAGRKVLLFGNGPVALRRARTLMAFGPDLTVIAPGRINLSLFAGPAGAAEAYRPGS